MDVVRREKISGYAGRLGRTGPGSRIATWTPSAPSGPLGPQTSDELNAKKYRREEKKTLKKALVIFVKTCTFKTYVLTSLEKCWVKKRNSLSSRIS